MSLAANFKKFTAKNYADQGKAFLNAYWQQHQGDDAEKVWIFWEKFCELDLDNGKEGNDLDEFNAHRFLEFFNETKTVKEMREQLTEADLDFNKRLALIEYLLWKYGHTVSDFLSKPQGSEEELKKFQEMLQRVQDALANAQKKAEEAQQATEEAKKREASAKEEAAKAKARENEAKAAEDELRTALNELKAQEDAYNQKTEQLKKKSEEGGVVSRNRAKNELAQHLAEDPLPLQRAKITQEAATKKAEKARLVAQEAANKAEESAKEAEKARVAAEEAADEASSAVAAAEEEVKKAEAKLEEAKLAGTGMGNIFWAERELAEAKKYMPKKKGGTW